MSRSGHISLVGRNESGMLVAHGEMQLGVMQLDYLWHGDDGSSDTGTIVITDDGGDHG